MEARKCYNGATTKGMSSRIIPNNNQEIVLNGGKKMLQWSNNQNSSHKQSSSSTQGEETEDHLEVAPKHSIAISSTSKR